MTLDFFYNEVLFFPLLSKCLGITAFFLLFWNFVIISFFSPNARVKSSWLPCLFNSRSREKFEVSLSFLSLSVRQIVVELKDSLVI